jgi:hypothetical protein
MSYTPKNKADLRNLGNDIFYKYIYPVYPKEFLLGNDYELFALKVAETFTLAPSQWEEVLIEWELKELILN